MTTYSFSDGDPCEVEIKGHAEYNPGNDIVCAACSVLTCLLVNMPEVQTAQVKPGHVKLTIKVTEKSGPVIEAVRGGFRMIRHKYPDNVSEA